jgi:arsenate reductase
MLKIYHNNRCKKSRAGLKYLLDKGLNPEVIDYIKNSINEKDFRLILQKLNISAKELIRTQEEIYKLQFKDKNFNEEEWIKIILENPKLLKRPIIETKYKAVLGDPVSNIEQAL